MLKIKYKLYLILFLISLANIFAQKEQSIQLNAGILYPRSASNGFSTFLKYNYQLNKTFNLYLYTGYSSWNKFYIQKVNYDRKDKLYTTYSSDKHVLIPIYIGTKINFHTNKLFTSFFEFEAGYSHLSYNSYENHPVFDEDNGEIISYKVDKRSRKKINSNLYGIGIGLGISHPLTQTLKVIIGYKLNSNFNSGDFGLFSAKGTYATLYVGLNFHI